MKDRVFLRVAKQLMGGSVVAISSCEKNNTKYMNVAERVYALTAVGVSASTPFKIRQKVKGLDGVRTKMGDRDMENFGRCVCKVEMFAANLQ